VSLLVYKGESILMDQLLLKPKNSLIYQNIDCQEGAVTVNGMASVLAGTLIRSHRQVYTKINCLPGMIIISTR
jgi:hypothetical protein